MFKPEDFEMGTETDTAYLNNYDPNFVMGVVVQAKGTDKKMYLYMDEESTFNIVSFDEEGKDCKHEYTLVEACKLVYILQAMLAEYIDRVADETMDKAEEN